MATFLLGINHNTASVDVREKVAFAPEKMHDALQQACADIGLDEMVIVSWLFFFLVLLDFKKYLIFFVYSLCPNAYKSIHYA